MILITNIYLLVQANFRVELAELVETFLNTHNTLVYGTELAEKNGFLQNLTLPFVNPSGFTSPRHRSLFFTFKGCLREDQSTCLPPTDPYYEITHNGLDAVIRAVCDQVMVGFHMHESWSSSCLLLCVTQHTLHSIN